VTSDHPGQRWPMGAGPRWARLLCLGKFNPVYYLILSVNRQPSLRVGLPDGVAMLALAVTVMARAAKPSPARYEISPDGFAGVHWL
jgi:hypothetical protein